MRSTGETTPATESQRQLTRLGWSVQYRKPRQKPPTPRNEAAGPEVGRMTRLTRSDAPTSPIGCYPLASVPGFRSAADIEPLLRMADLTRVLNCSRREVERMRASGRLPRPDLTVGSRSPRWRHESIRRWVERGGK